MRILTYVALVLLLLLSTACSSYNDYATAYSNHMLNDRARMTTGTASINTMYMDTIAKIYSGSPYLVEMTTFDAKGNPVPFKIKDTSRDMSAMFMAMMMANSLQEVNVATSFNLDKPTTWEDVFMKSVGYLPWLATFGMVNTMSSGMGDTNTFNASDGSSIATGSGTSTSSWSTMSGDGSFNEMLPVQ